ncbi:MAG: PepSY-like domain-containing protein [Alistipes sp.]
MKNYFKSLAVILLASGFIFVGCSDDDATKQNTTAPAEQTVKAFQAKFPAAQNVQWAKKRGYDVATFTLKGTRAANVAAPANSAWYLEGTATCAYVDEEITLEQLKKDAPKVAAAWEASPRKKEGYLLEDIDVLTHATEAAVYKLEVEKGELEYELYYTKEGVLLREQADADETDDKDENEPCPQAIYDFIKLNFATAIVVEFDIEDEGGMTYYEVEVTINGKEKELVFDKESQFLFVIVEIDEEALPEAINKAFLALAPNSEDWSDIAQLENEKGAVIGYMLIVEDEKTNTEKTFMVDAKGNTLK